MLIHFLPGIVGNEDSGKVVLSKERMMEELRMNVPRKDCLDFCHGAAVSDPFRFVSYQLSPIIVRPSMPVRSCCMLVKCLN